MCFPPFQFNEMVKKKEKLISRYIAHINISIFGTIFQLIENLLIFTIFTQAMFCLKSKSHHRRYGIQKKIEGKNNKNI